MILKKIYKIKALSKINLCLLVGRKLPQLNYHSIATITARTNLSDEITIELEDYRNIPAKLDENFSWTLNVKVGEKLSDHLGSNNNILQDLNSADNLIHKTLKIISESELFNLKGYRINILLTKQIPIYAGLGGGSADAASIINFLSELCNVKMTDRIEIASRVCNDCVLCLDNDCQQSIFDGSFDNSFLNKHFLNKKKLYCLLFKPVIGSSTKEAYLSLNRTYSEGKEDLFLEGQLEELSSEKKNIEEIIFNNSNNKNTSSHKIKNDFEEYVLSLSSSIRDGFLEISNSNPLLYGVTGSGSTIYGIYDNLETSKKLIDKLKKDRVFISIDELFF